MDNWFRSKWFVRLISLTFAIILYMFVQTTIQSTQSDTASSGSGTETQTLDDVPVEIRIDDEYVVSGVPEFVTVSLEGPPNYLRPIVLQRNFDVFVDLHGYTEGEHTVEIEYDVSSQLNMYIEPAEIDIYIEKRVSQDYPVSVDFTNQNQLPDGYELGNFEVNPAVVNITSSNSIIDRIGTVKVFVDVAGVTESIKNQEYPVKVYDAQGNELKANIQPEKVRVSAEILNPSKKVKIEVPTTGELPEGYNLVSITPSIEEVEIFAKSDILAGIETISTEEIDLSKISKSGTIEVKFDLPEGVVIKGSQSVEIDIQVELSKKFEDLVIHVDGLNGQNAKIIEPEEEKTSITLKGNESEIGEITKEDIRLFVDATGLTAGQHSLPLEVEWLNEVSEVAFSSEMEKVRIDIE